MSCCSLEVVDWVSGVSVGWASADVSECWGVVLWVGRGKRGWSVGGDKRTTRWSFSISLTDVDASKG